MAVGRISGPLLKSNLLRDGKDLAFETDLLVLDVKKPNDNKLTASIGINNSNPDPAYSLDITGETRSTDLKIIDDSVLGNVKISVNTITTVNGNLILSPATNTDFINLNGNVEVSGNLHATGNITADGDIVLGDANTDNITFKADINSDLLPDVADPLVKYNIGSEEKTWLTGYFETIDADNLLISTDNGKVTYKTNEIDKIYVQQSGNDFIGDGRNIASAYRTIKKALEVAQPGQTVVISPGEYIEAFPLEVPQGVAVVGSGLRSTTIIPTTATQNKNGFLLNGESTVQDLTIKDMFYDSVNDTGYAFSYAPGSIITSRSPYIKDVSVINKGSFQNTSFSEDQFGHSVAVGDDRIVVGAYRAEYYGSLSGAAYVFDLYGNKISQLVPYNVVANDSFGTSVAVGSGRIVVGASGDDDNGSSSGSAYIFDLNGNELTKITASDAAAGILFGSSVAVGSGRIVVGAYAGPGIGSAYIFDLDGNEIAKVTASAGAASDRFGYSVSVESNTIIVGAPYDNANGTQAGAAYIFDLDGNEIAKIIASDGAAGDNFGENVAVGSNRIVVGAKADDDNGGSSGSAYIFDLNGNELTKITASDGDAGDNFGVSVAIGSNTIVVGSYFDDDNGSSSGSAYIFDLNGNELTKITASDGAANDYFGYSVSVQSDTIVVGSPLTSDNGPNSGSAYIFDLAGNEINKVFSFQTNDPFGYAIGDAGRGIKVDGALVSRNSLEVAMLFDSITLIVPNSIGLEITNGARVEWLNSFIYFADLGIHGYAGTEGIGGLGKTYIELDGVTGIISAGDYVRFLSTDGSSRIGDDLTNLLMVDDVLPDGKTIVINGKEDRFETFPDYTPEEIAFFSNSNDVVTADVSAATATATKIVNYDRKEFGAELRSIASANVYGDKGVKADGDDVRLRLSSHDFGYIGSRGKFDNNDIDVVTANEVIQVNGGKVFFNSSDQYGDFRVGEYFRVNQETGEVTFDVEGFQVQNSTGITITDGINTAILSPTELQVGNLNLAGNAFTSTSGDINIEAASDIINIDSTTVFNGSHPINVVLDEDDLISDRDDALPTQQSVKKYVDSREADRIPLGYPEDSVWEDGAYIRFRSDDTVAQAIDDLNEVINNVRRNSFIRAVDFNISPTKIGSGKDLTVTITPEGTADKYVIDWGDGTSSTYTIDIEDDNLRSSPYIFTHQYNQPDGGLFTVTVNAYNQEGELVDGSYTTGSFESETKIDYITIYTPDPVVDFNFYRALTGGTALAGNNLYVIEGESLYLENLTTNTLKGDSEFTINWGDGNSETITQPKNNTTVPGGVNSSNRLEHIWPIDSSSGTLQDTVTLTVTAVETADPAFIATSPSKSIQLKVYDATPDDPNNLGTKYIRFSSASSPSAAQNVSPYLAANATDNSGGTAVLSAGQPVIHRTVLDTAGTTIDSLEISNDANGTQPAFAYKENAQILSVMFNGSVDGNSITFDNGVNQTNQYEAPLEITAESDYNLLNAIGRSITFNQSIYYPDAFKGFKARIRKPADAVPVGVNNFYLSQTTSSGTVETINRVDFVKDDLTATPVVTAGTLSEKTGIYKYISGIPYYTSGSSLTLSGVTVDNFIGQTYRNTTQVLEVANGTNLEGTSQNSIGTQYYTYSDIDGSVTFLTGGVPNANTGNGTPYTLGDITVNITGSAVRTIEQLRLRAYNVNGTGSFVTNTQPIQVHTADQSGISEIAISVSSALGSGYNTNGRRIFNFASNPVNTPAFSSTVLGGAAVNYYTSNPYTEFADPGVQGTQEATIRLGRLEHNTNDYSTYLPAGPNRTGDTGTQYFTFAFQRTVVANFTVNITSATGISGFWIAAPGTAIDGSSTLNGWLDASLPYNGSGLPGAGTGGNGSNGCAATSGDVITSGVALSGSKTLTLGTENLSNATNNVCLVRIALAAGQSITTLGIS